jgi:hypothetical protein
MRAMTSRASIAVMLGYLETSWNWSLARSAAASGPRHAGHFRLERPARNVEPHHVADIDVEPLVDALLD